MSYRASPIAGLQSYPYADRLSYSPINPVIPPFIMEEAQSFTHQILKDKEFQINRLDEEVIKIRNLYEQQILTYKKTIQALERQLFERDNLQDLEYQKIKEKIDKMKDQESETLKTLHSHQIEFLLKEVAQQRAANDTLNLKLTLQAQQFDKFKESYERQISTNVSQINSLNKLVSKLEDEKNRQIRDLNSKRDLQKSRTSGLISSRMQSHTFIDKQLRKLNEEVLQKTLQIEGLSRELNREKKRYDDTVREQNNSMNEIKQKYQQQLQQERQQNIRTERALKTDLKQVKQQIIGYMQQIDTLQGQLSLNDKEVLSLRQDLLTRRQQIQSLKLSLQRQREQHATQMMTVMKDRRKSRSNVGSSRSIISLRQSGQMNSSQQAGTRFDNQFSSVRLESNLLPIKEESPQRAEQKDYSRELADSHLQDDDIIVQSQLQRAVYHYDNLIQELKKNHEQQLQVLQMSEKKVRNRLQEKEQELLDILTKFSPLVKIHAGEKSIQQDRRQRIQRHWKGDVALLEILLRKYKIKVFQ